MTILKSCFHNAIHFGLGEGASPQGFHKVMFSFIWICEENISTHEISENISTHEIFHKLVSLFYSLIKSN